MSDFTGYRDKVQLYGKQAYQAEQDKQYEAAYDYLMKAIDIFMHMIKCKFSFLNVLINSIRREESEINRYL